MASDRATTTIDPKQLRQLVLATVPPTTRSAHPAHAREPSALRGLFKLAMLALVVRELAVWLG